MTATLAPSLRTCDISDNGETLIDALLADQQTTAVERFAQFHDIRDQTEAGPSPRYHDLVPLTRPGEGEQYAFEVDLDACSGCKACVAACHNLNGLEEAETWRNVGLLVGGSDRLPVLQHVTTACHHCIDPACLIGCPVNAYDKDPVTGIVRHLDDQCIGCQYCIFKCPYDVPVYSPSKGIVRKCDMCRDRLAASEAPACAQACPNHAIRIRIIDRQEVIDGTEANQFLPGAHEPGYTLPTTLYKSRRNLPRNLLPADFYAAKKQHAHLPLVWMLVLTQMSVGAFIVEHLLTGRWLPTGAMSPVERTIHLLTALLLGMLGLFAAVFHLGRPQYAFRALLGLRTSWLSREILAFGLYALFATGYAGFAFIRAAAPWSATWPEQVCGVLAALTGLVSVLCSVMVYVDTRRPFWSGTPTMLKFLLTAAVLGLPLALSVGVWSSWATDRGSLPAMMDVLGKPICVLLVGVVLAKLSVELSIFVHLRAKRHSVLKRTAMLMSGDLSRVTLLRLFFGIVGGILLPIVLVAEDALAAADGFQPMFVGVVSLLMLAILVVGEFLERYLFFAASVAPKMPGVQAT